MPDTPPPPPPPTKAKPRRIVGLSLGSTVKGGNGPAFGVGNTRMGKTEKTAAKPDEAKPLPKTKEKPPPQRVNRVATRVPTAECKLKRPLPKGPQLEPPYPKEYEAQELEARVVLELRISVDGRVKSAKVVKPSRYTKFNENAVATAKKQRFTPATCGGKPQELVISYAYKFEMPDS